MGGEGEVSFKSLREGGTVVRVNQHITIHLHS